MNIQKENCGEYIVSGWHLEKRVTIGQIVTLITILISGLCWASSVETRMVGLSSEDRRIEEKTDIVIRAMGLHFDTYKKDTVRALNRIDRSITKLGDKIDSKADK